MPQKFDHLPDKRLITGGSGTGKTTLVESLMRKEKARLKFVYDHEGQFCQRYGHEPVYADGLDEAVARGGWVVFDPSEDFESDFEQGLEFYCDYILALSKELKGRKLFHIDELDLLTSNTKYPRALVAVMQTGRRYEIDCFFISGQPNNLHNRVRSQLTAVYTFFHSDRAALEFLTDNGIPEETIRSLGEHGWFYRHLRTGATQSNLKSLPKLAKPAEAAAPDPGAAEKTVPAAPIDAA